MEVLRKEFRTWDFQDRYHLSLMNERHIMIRFTDEADYKRCWMKAIWNVGGFFMRIIQMTPEFDYNKESPIAPIWIAFQGIPYEFYKVQCIMNMAMVVGTPLKVDAPTENGSRPSVARVCVAADITAELSTSVVIGK